MDFLEFVKEQGVTLTDDLLVMSGKLEVLEYLLSNGLNVNAVIEKSERRQATALTGADNFRVLEYLLNSGADPNILVMRGYKGMSSVLMLILDKYYENEELEVLPMVKLLISREKMIAK